MFEIGNSLREARVRQGLEYPQVELATKIRVKYIRALEDEQFAVLPAQPYIKGFLRTYADFLGLDGQLYVDEYNSRFIVDRPEETPLRRVSPRARRERGIERKVVLLALVGIAALTGLVIVAWKFGGGDSPATPGVRDAAVGAPRLGAAADRSGEGHLRRGAAALGDGHRAPAGDDPRRKGGARARHPLLAVREASGRRARHACRQAGVAPGAQEPEGRRHAVAHGARRRLNRPRAFVVATGSELVRGERTDLNGPFLARERCRLGIEPARIAIVGDGADELEAALREGLDADACSSSPAGSGRPTTTARSSWSRVPPASACTWTSSSERRSKRSRVPRRSG